MGWSNSSCNHYRCFMARKTLGESMSHDMDTSKVRVWWARCEECRWESPKITYSPTVKLAMADHFKLTKHRNMTRIRHDVTPVSTNRTRILAVAANAANLVAAWYIRHTGPEHIKRESPQKALCSCGARLETY